jgi:membrane protease YdiL (CAAX protease family)
MATHPAPGEEKSMTVFDDPKSPVPDPSAEQASEQSTESGQSLEQLAEKIVVGVPEPAQTSFSDSDSPGYLPSVSPATPHRPLLPEDLRVPWGWLHFLSFMIFGIVSFAITQIGAVVYLVAQSHNTHLTQKELERLYTSKPIIPITATILLYVLIILFLYISISALKDLPFWRTFGWRKLVPTAAAPAKPWIYLVGGIALSFCVAIVSSRLKTPENLPIEEMFKSRYGAFLLMGVAVLIAPLVEETVFRGYLYPLFAKSLGIAPGIVITGVLFGLMHAPQLGWTWGLVAMLIGVGIVFTLARAKAGTVLASFLLHLAYNSTFAFSAIVATHGFTRMPPHP